MEGNESNILTKVTFKNSKRIRASCFMVKKFINLHDLENEIKIRHPEYSRKRFEITYKDSENNDVVIACDDDLKLMFVGREEGILKLNVQGGTEIQNETKRGFWACLRKFFCCGLCLDKASTADVETTNVRNSIATLPKSREDLENIEQGQEQEQEQEEEKEQKQAKEKEPEQQEQEQEQEQEREKEQKQEQKKEPELPQEQEQEQKQEKGKEQQQEQSQEHEHGQEKEGRPKEQVPPSMFQLVSPSRKLTETSLKSAEVFDNLDEIEKRKFLVQEETNKRLPSLKGSIIEEALYNRQKINEQGKIAQNTDQSANVEKGFSIANKSLVYIAPLSGERYHSTPTCWGLRNANSIQQISFENIDFRTPCLICYRSSTPLVQEINNSPGPLFSMKQRDRVQAKQSVYIAPYSDETAKKLYKYKNHCPKSLLGAINIEKMSQEIIAHLYTPQYQNIMLISEYGTDLMQKLIDFPEEFNTIIVSFILIIFIKGGATDMINELYLPFNSRFLLVHEKNASIFQITDVHQIGINGSKTYSNFGTWDKERKLTTSKESFYFRRMDLKGHVISTQTPSNPVYASLWVMFSEKMNFTVNYKAVVYGGIFPNGTKTGIFKMLQDHELDGTQHNYKYSHQRADHFDYIFPVYIAETLIYMEVQGSLNWTLFIALFRIGIWIALIAWVVLSSIVSYFTFNKSKPDYIHHGFGSFIFGVMQALCNQGNRVANPNVSYYIAHLMPYLLGIVIVNSYSGVFLSHLTVENLQPPFKNLEEIVEDGSYKILVESGSYPMYYFQTDDAKEAVLVREKDLVPENEQIPFEVKKAGFSQLCNNKIIYISGTMDYTIEENCNVMNLKEMLFYDVEGIIVWRGFPYTYVMNKLLKRIQFAGLIKLRRKDTIITYENVSNESLSLEILLPIFLIYLCLIIFSIVVLICEIAVKKYY